MTNNKKYKRILWSGKNKESGLIAYGEIYQTKKEAIKCFKLYTGYRIVKILIKEV